MEGPFSDDPEQDQSLDPVGQVSAVRVLAFVFKGISFDDEDKLRKQIGDGELMEFTMVQIALFSAVVSSFACLRPHSLLGRSLIAPRRQPQVAEPTRISLLLPQMQDKIKAVRRGATCSVGSFDDQVKCDDLIDRTTAPLPLLAPAPLSLLGDGYNHQYWAASLLRFVAIHLHSHQSSFVDPPLRDNVRFMVKKFERFGWTGKDNSKPALTKLIKISDYPTSARPLLAEDDDEYFVDDDGIKVEKGILLAGEKPAEAVLPEGDVSEEEKEGDD